MMVFSSLQLVCRRSHTQSISNPLALFASQHDSAKLIVHAVALVEADAILGYHVQFPAKGAKGLAMYAVRMACCMYIWPPLVYGAVNGKGRRIDGLIAFHHLSLLVDQYQVGHAYQ
jgi:hypothetical protein